MKRRASVLAFAVIVLAGVREAAAPSDRQAAEAQGQQIIDAGNNTIALLIEKFRPAFPSDHRDLLSQSKIRVVVLADFNAFADYKTRRILIPAQFVSEIVAQVQAFLIVQRNPALQRQYAEWLIYLSERSERVRRRARAGETSVDDVPVEPFWTFADLPVPGALSGADTGIQEIMMMDSLALVVAHELGHLVLNHRPYNEIGAADSRQQEYAADAFAASLLGRSGMSVIPGLNTFILRFAANEALTKGISQDEKTHPPAECRLYRLGNPAIEELLKSPDRRRDFERSGTSVAQFRSTMKALESECSP